MMKKQAQAVLAKYGRRGCSSIASSPLSSRVKQAWEEQNKVVLGLVFMGGWFTKALINVYKRREDYYRVDRICDDEEKRVDEKEAYILNEMKKFPKLDDDV